MDYSLLILFWAFWFKLPRFKLYVSVTLSNLINFADDDLWILFVLGRVPIHVHLTSDTTWPSSHKIDLWHISLQRLAKVSLKSFNENPPYWPKNCFLFRTGLLDPAQKCDILKAVIFIVTVYLMSYIDTSFIYHLVRAQTLIKLYIIYNMLEVRVMRQLTDRRQSDKLLIYFLSSTGCWSIVFVIWSRYIRCFVLDGHWINTR